MMAFAKKKTYDPDHGIWLSGLALKVTDPAARAFRAWGLDHPRVLLVIWAAIRLFVLLTWGLLRPETQGDVVYYYEHIANMFTAGAAQTMPEYPTPVLWLLLIPYWLGFGTRVGYVIAFAFLMLALDAAFSWTLWRHGQTLRAQAVAAWSVFVGFIGPTFYLRFDLVTTVLAGWSLVLLIKQHNRLAGVFAGIGAAIKLWPALLWPALGTGTKRQKLVITIAFWASGASLALLSLLWAGWTRLLSPLSWQSGRGLQVESVWASVPMLLRTLGIGDYAVAVSRFQAFEIYGTTVSFWLKATTFATAIGLLWALISYVLWWRRGKGRMIEGAAFMLLVILIMIVTNKTFSPQYLIWLGGPLVAALALLGRSDRNEHNFVADRRRLLTITALVLAATVCTGIVFPFGYDWLVRDSSESYWLRTPITLVLVLRNLLVCAICVQVLRWVASFTIGSNRQTATEDRKISAS